MKMQAWDTFKKGKIKNTDRLTHVDFVFKDTV